MNVALWPQPGRSQHNAPMATFAHIRQQLVEALELDLIGPGWEDVASRRGR
jgi:hypothetical protein